MAQAAAVGALLGASTAFLAPSAAPAPAPALRGAPHSSRDSTGPGLAGAAGVGAAALGLGLLAARPAATACRAAAVKKKGVKVVHGKEIPWNLFSPKAPYQGKVVENDVHPQTLTEPTGDANWETTHVTFDHGGKVPYIEGQSIGVIAPGPDKKGEQPAKIRLYSIASSAVGDDQTSKTVSLCVKRVVEVDGKFANRQKGEDKPDKAGTAYPDNQVYRGVCSNHICDMTPGDEVLITGPTGADLIIVDIIPGSAEFLEFMALDNVLNFYIFGSPVTMSPSPEIHGTGFKVNGSPHKYSRFDSDDVEKVFRQLKKDDCGGGSVTIPHKESIKKHMNHLTEAARIIGAVNTVTKVQGQLKGDNTDWIGIKNQLETRIRQQGRRTTSLCGLVCGAGGTARAAAYALKQMGATRVLIFNRTVSRAEDLASEFGFEACGDLDALRSVEQLHVVVNTLPGNSEFVLPDRVASILTRCHPVVLEAAYIPRRTAFLLQALAAGCEVVEGIEMLFEQGCAQCELWTGKPAPRSKIAQALLQALFTVGSEHPAHAKMQPYNDLPKSLLLEARSSHASSQVGMYVGILVVAAAALFLSWRTQMRRR